MFFLWINVLGIYLHPLALVQDELFYITPWAIYYDYQTIGVKRVKESETTG